jgi:hypothetical protein
MSNRWAIMAPASMIHFYHVIMRFDRYSTALLNVTFHIEKGKFVFTWKQRRIS